MSSINLNSWSGTGTVASHPQFHEQKRLSLFTLHIDERFQGEPVRTTIRVKHFGAQFEFLSKTLILGCRVAVTGAIVEDQVSTREGIKKELLIHAQKVMLLTSLDDQDTLREIIDAANPRFTKGAR